SVPDNAASHPMVTIDAPLPVPTGTFMLNQQVPTNFDCSSSLVITNYSGSTDGSAASIQSGGRLDTTTPGTHTFTVAAEDAAGNAATKSVTYTVLFRFGGFQDPVSNPSALNIVNAGSAIPLKWTLLDAAGNAYAN